MTEVKRKSKPKVDLYHNMEVTLKSGLSFRMGQPIRPTVLDIRQVFGKLYASIYAAEVTGTGLVPELLIKCNQEQLDILVPLVAKKIDYLLQWGEVNTADEPWVVTCGYVLAWYWHLNLNGARPVLETVRQKKANAYRTKITPTTPDLRCEFCNKVYPDVEKYVKYSTLAYHFMVWLGKHYQSYHKWDIKVTVQNSTRKED